MIVLGVAANFVHEPRAVDRSNIVDRQIKRSVAPVNGMAMKDALS